MNGINPTVEATVPWQFSESGEFSQWLWATRDFTAVVACDAGRWTWQVRGADERTLGVGAGPDFTTSVDLVLEAVGKAMPLSAGYDRWTHEHARRYTLATGHRVDLAEGEGKWVRVTLVDGQTLTGELGLGDWLLHITEGTVQRDVHPSHVTKVELVA